MGPYEAPTHPADCCRSKLGRQHHTKARGKDLAATAVVVTLSVGVLHGQGAEPVALVLGADRHSGDPVAKLRHHPESIGLAVCELPVV